jgi:methionine-gamma-lyase
MDKSFPLTGWSSLAVHAGHEQDPNYAHLVPIYASSTYVFDDAEQGMRRFSGKEEGYIYSRWGNPTMNEAEEKIAALETFELNMEVKGILHASGMAAISTLMLGTLKPGDKIIFPCMEEQKNLYQKFFLHLALLQSLPTYGTYRKPKTFLNRIQLLR